MPPLVEFPYTAVGFGPDVAHVVPQRVEQVGAGRVQVRTGPVHRQPHAFEQVPVASQLRLADGVVAASYRHRVAVTAQPQFGLLVGRVAAQAVEGMDDRCRRGDTAQHPGERALHFLGQAEADDQSSTKDVSRIHPYR